MGRPSRRIYVVDKFAFIQLQGSGLWMRVDRSVVRVACSMCNQPINQPCVGHDGNWWVGTHYQRRRDAAKLPTKLPGFTVIET